MSVDLVLHATHRSGLVLPATLEGALRARPEDLTRPFPAVRARGRTLTFALDLAIDDPACAGFLLDFERQGARVKGGARGPSEPLLAWAFHTAATRLGCELYDGTDATDAKPAAHRDDAIAYLERYEREVEHDRRARADGRAVVDPMGFVAWLAREGHVAIVGEAPSEWPEGASLDDPASLYETLLAHHAIDEVFVGETELTTLLERYRARG